MKKIYFIIGTLSNGGAERVVSNLSLRLKDNIEREIILFGHDARIDYPYKGKLSYLDQYKEKNMVQKVCILIKRIIFLRKIKKRNPDAIFVSFLEYPNLLNILSGYNYNTIVSVRNFMSVKHKNGLKSYFWNQTIKRLYNYSKKVVAVSEQIKYDLIENYQLNKEKIEVIYNSYDINRIQKLAGEELTDEEKLIFENPTIITVGRLVYQKGQHHLIKAFSYVKEKIPNSQLIILGDGDLKEDLITLSDKLNIANNVHFLGFQKNPFKYIARSKVFVLTSYYEGFPNALAEAMACKVPVISTDCPSGPREILAPGKLNENINYGINKNFYGVLIPTFNEKNYENMEKHLSKIIYNLITDEKLNRFFAKRSLERVKDFDINKVVKEWENLL